MSCTNTIPAGQFDRKIRILSYTEGKDQSGAPLNIFDQLAAVWAKVEQRSAKETEEVTRETSFTKTFFTIRYRADVDAKMKILYKNKGYNIHGILKLDRKRYLRIIAEQAEQAAGDLVSGNPWTDNDGNPWITNEGETWF